MTMTELPIRCVLLSPNRDERWAVPQNCLAEILTLGIGHDAPLDTVNWRGRQVPVVDFGVASGGARLVAVFLGLAGEGCDYWGVAVNGAGLAVVSLSPGEVTDAPDAVVEHAQAAFRYGDALYQVPDLERLQRRIADGKKAA